MNGSDSAYRGRLAPSPTGLLHLGHARTFWIAQLRCHSQNGTLILRNEDLDRDRCRVEFAQAMIEDLRWFGLQWQEGPDIGGPCAPYVQSQRRYDRAFQTLFDSGHIYPCTCSRKDILTASAAPHAGDDEPVYPGTCRPRQGSKAQLPTTDRVSWRFRVPSAQTIRFNDRCQGPQQFIAGEAFGDFVVWRHGQPSYQLAVVVDDAAMGVTEVVRGADLLNSTARQLLLYQALGWVPPGFYHCTLLTDETGRRLAKRHDGLSLRALRQGGARPEDLRAGWES